MTENEKVQQPVNELVSRAAKGDMAAFEEIHRRYRRFVYAAALRMTGNPADAEDLAQESFIVLMQKIGSFRGEAAFTTWLYRLTVNQVLMYLRRRKCRPEDQTSDGNMPEYRSGGAGTVNSSAVLDRLAIERAVGALPPGYRSAFILYDVEGYQHKEIARIMGCEIGTAKSQLHRARAKLRRLLSNPERRLSSQTSSI
ncbi:MAG: sigma-70 family RNA polymerase sigma factor [Acidobacteria bacterium]|nr:sigma-70 family RNA polymerase sigma factor [Acidobacteriota bacterium]